MRKRIITSGCSYNTAKENSKIYLIRWVMLERAKYALYLHKFVSSDTEDLHDHPWNFITFVLWRGYNEEFLDACGVKCLRRVYPLTFNYRRATHTHRVLLVEDRPAVTIVLRFKYVRWWGFIVRGAWVKFSDYFASNDCR